jgi:hypothetical protein
LAQRGLRRTPKACSLSGSTAPPGWQRISAGPVSWSIATEIWSRSLPLPRGPWRWPLPLHPDGKGAFEYERTTTALMHLGAGVPATAPTAAPVGYEHKWAIVLVVPPTAHWSYSSHFSGIIRSHQLQAHKPSKPWALAEALRKF